MGIPPSYAVRPVAWVHSSLAQRADAPKQSYEGAPAIDHQGWLHVQGLEAIHGTPVIDIKPVLELSSDS